MYYKNPTHVKKVGHTWELFFMEFIDEIWKSQKIRIFVKMKRKKKRWRYHQHSRKPKFWKNEKSIWRCHHFKLVQQKTWSYDVCLLRYGVWQTWWSYDIWFLRYGAWQIEFFIISSYFLPFYPPNNTKNQNFEKMIKTPGGIIILNVSAMKENHMINDSWDMEQNFLPFYTPFPTLTTQRIKILKKRKKRLEYHHLIQVYQKSWSNALLFLRYGMQQM